MRKWRWFVVADLVFLIIVGIDQWTKYWISTNLSYNQRWDWTSWLEITHLHNTGSAFGFFSSFPSWFFIALALIIGGVLSVWAWRAVAAGNRLMLSGITLVLAGAVGNVIDRIQLGYVVDFIFVHVQQWYWPAFNVADASISVGVVLLLWDSWLDRENKQKKSPGSSEPGDRSHDSHRNSHRDRHQDSRHDSHDDRYRDI